METTIGEELYDLAGEDSPLEKYILEIDNNIGDDTILRGIAGRIGIFVPENEMASSTLYIKLKDYLSRNIDPDVTENRINMTLEEYANELNDSDISPEDLNMLYSNRLLE